MKASGFVESGVELRNPDFAVMARAMGIHAVRAEDLGELSYQSALVPTLMGFPST
jgi:pyruvate dehydrogenase (quinone)